MSFSANMTIGDDCKIFPFTSIRLQPQDLKFGGETSTLSIGDRNIVREYVTMDPGTEGGGLVTLETAATISLW